MKISLYHGAILGKASEVRQAYELCRNLPYSLKICHACAQEFLANVKLNILQVLARELPLTRVLFDPT